MRCRCWSGAVGGVGGEPRRGHGLRQGGRCFGRTRSITSSARSGREAIASRGCTSVIMAWLLVSSRIQVPVGSSVCVWRVGVWHWMMIRAGLVGMPTCELNMATSDLTCSDYRHALTLGKVHSLCVDIGTTCVAVGHIGEIDITRCRVDSCWYHLHAIACYGHSRH